VGHLGKSKNWAPLSAYMYHIIKKHKDKIKFPACLAVSFIIFFHIPLVMYFVLLYIRFYVVMLSFNFVNYVFLWLCVYSYIFVYIRMFLLLCMFRSVYSVSLCFSVYFLCVNVNCTTATACKTNCS